MCREIFDIPINKVFVEKLIHSVGRGLFEWRSEQLIEQKNLRKKFALRFSFLNYSKQLSISNFLTFFKWIFRSEVHPLVEMHADAKYKKDWTKEACLKKRTFAPTFVGEKSRPYPRNEREGKGRNAQSKFHCQRHGWDPNVQMCTKV